MSLSLSKNHEDKWGVEEWLHIFLNSELSEVNDHFHATVILKPAKQRPTVTTGSEEGGLE